jgi:hypothetical protein
MDIKNWEEKYKAVSSRIEREDYTIVYVYKHGQKVATVTGKGFSGERKVEFFGEYKSPGKQFNVETMRKLFVVEEDFKEDLLKAAREKRMKDRNEFWSEFKQALFEYHGIQNHPKREKFFEILRSNKGSPSAIYGEAEEWVDLLK